ncbi:MAG: hypothetical protein ILA34_02820 [Bacteroidaceae bacterium]|nr:hypothetical protein [Bacteroidaceae bacterium]
MKIIVLSENRLQSNKLGLPAFYNKPDSTLVRSGKPFFLPEWGGSWQVTLHMVAVLNRLGKSFAPRFAPRYYDQVALGLIFQPEKAEDSAWGAHVLDGSTVVGLPLDKKLLPTDGCMWCSDNKPVNVSFSPQDCLAEMDLALSALSQLMTWRHGDLLFSRPLHVENHLAESQLVEAMMAGTQVLKVAVK